jgi:magnesium chelatase family protein
MALARSLSVALVGVTAHVVQVEADVAVGLPTFILSALSDRVLKGVEHRVKSAVNNAGETWPQRRVTVGLSPASVPKSGSGFDLPIAVTLLAAAGALPAERVERLVFLGELGLGGEIRPVTGVLPAVIGAVRQGHTRIVVPRGNAREARVVGAADVLAVRSLAQLCAWLRGEVADDEVDGDEPEEPPAAEPGDQLPDLVDVVGQERGRRAIEIAAAGGHHLLLSGPPGVGKTMLAERLPGVLPELSRDEAMEVTAIHSVAGRLAPGRPLITRAPFCAPHHSTTIPAIVGGGAGIAQPGAVSLAHRGVLFLDEAPEFGSHALDALRQPLESGQVTIARSGGVAVYPARFLLVLAGNPCPCAAGGRDVSMVGCICPAAVRQRYRARLSGPLRDRIDVVVSLDPVSRLVLAEGARGESSAAVLDRVLAARDRTAHRLRDTGWDTWGAVPGPALRRHFPVPGAALAPVHQAVARHTLSTRGIDRVLKVAWTLTDLAGADRPGADQVQEALSLRNGDHHQPPLAVTA